MVSIKQLIAHVEHTLGGRVNNGLGGSIAVVNAAGRHFHAMHPWAWAQRASVSLSQVSGVASMALPDDFGELLALESTNSLVRRTQMVTLDEILRLRTSNLPLDNWVTKCAVSWKLSDEDRMQPYLEMWPTPSADASDTHTLFYRAKWYDATDDDAIVYVPPFAEPLLMELCRTFARGWEGEEQGTLSERLAMVQAGPLFLAAVNQDNAAQVNYGPMRGGLTSYGRGDPEHLDSYTVTFS